MVNGLILYILLNNWFLDDDDGFFTESTNRPRKKSKIRRNLFRKAAIGILFLMTLKRRSIKTRTVSLSKNQESISLY
jgi:hypothetical protein